MNNAQRNALAKLVRARADKRIQALDGELDGIITAATERAQLKTSYHKLQAQLKLVELKKQKLKEKIRNLGGVRRSWNYTRKGKHINGVEYDGRIGKIAKREIDAHLTAISKLEDEAEAIIQGIWSADSIVTTRQLMKVAKEIFPRQ